MNAPQDEADKLVNGPMSADIAAEQASASGPDWTDDFSRVIEVETAYIQKRRATNPDNPEAKDSAERPITGLALSGGGIRSAAFAIGCMQALQKAGIFKRVDYLSTVSGGGYAGTALTWYLNYAKLHKCCESNPHASVDFGIKNGQFPFLEGSPPTAGGAAHPAADRTVASGASIVDFIRQRSAYLQPGEGLTKLSALFVLLRSTFISTLAFTLTFAIGFTLLLLAPIAISGQANKHFPLALALAGAGLAFLIGSWIFYSIFSGSAIPGQAYSTRRWIERYGGRVGGLTVLLLVIGGLDCLYHALVNCRDSGSASAVSGFIAAVGAIAGYFTRFLSAAKKTGMNGYLAALLPFAAALLLIAGFGLLSMALAHLLFPQFWWLLIGIVPLTLFFLLYANINNSGLHRMYRDRLMETFTPSIDAVRQDSESAESNADKRYLHEMCTEGVDAPYHLINTHMIMLKGQKATYRSRGGDSFILSPRYCGSSATGWARTDRWPTAQDEHGYGLGLQPVGLMTLPTAMAISGAALNPRAGADGRGPTKSFAVSFVLTLLNLRLGYWIPSPNPERHLAQYFNSGQKKFLSSIRFPPNFIFPGLLDGLLGLRHNENSGWVDLSDGGHFDNTGLYELFRRRVPVIILSDGSADPEFLFSSLSNALDKAYIDMGVTVSFEDYPEFSFQHMIKGSGVKREDPVSERQAFSRHGFAVAEIRYPAVTESGKPAETGHLFYLKTSMIEGLPARLYSYKEENPDFPDEPTTDQFFSEQQFEAYRLLGNHLVWQMRQKLSEAESGDGQASPGEQIGIAAGQKNA